MEASQSDMLESGIVAPFALAHAFHVVGDESALIPRESAKRAHDHLSGSPLWPYIALINRSWVVQGLPIPIVVS